MHGETSSRVCSSSLVAYLMKHQIALVQVQRRAMKLVPTIVNLSNTNRLKVVGLPTIEYRRKRADMLQVYKILHG